MAEKVKQIIGYIVPSETYAQVLQNMLEQPGKVTYAIIKTLESCDPVYAPDPPPGDKGDT